MTATEQATTTATRGEPLNPITLAVIRSGLINAVAEMKAVVVRTAYSNLWKEAGDLSCAILTGKGELLAPGLGDIPVHLVTMPTSLAGCLKRFPLEELRPGDVLYQNDPYQGNNHLPDFLMAKPVFADGVLVAFAAVRGHYVDVGGMAPGSYTTATTEIYTEGIRIPPVKIFEEGVMNEDVVNILQTNTRGARERMGDLRSQYAGCLAAERRILAFCERYGVEALTQAMEEILDASERLARVAISEIPDGVYTFEDACDGDGIDNEPFTLKVKVTVSGDEIDVDFTGSAPQVRGGMNAPPAVTSSATIYAIKCLTDPENMSNSGSMRPVKVTAPPGTVLNPLPPAPVVAGNHETASRVVDVVIGALAQAVPDRVCAAASGTSGIIALGTRIVDEDGVGREAIMVETHGCGQGANIDGDGVNARRVEVGNTGNTPNEVLEASFPITMLRYALNQGGGPGRRRGGTSIMRVMRLDADCTLTITAERGTVAPYGLFGGMSGSLAEFRAEMPDGTVLELPSKTAPQRLPKGTIVTYKCAGGGGYGPPTEREIELVQADLDDGYISVEAAREQYGVTVEHRPDRAEGEWLVVGRPG